MTVEYTNPVWPDYFADPFVLRHDTLYYAYGTGPAADNGRIFPLLKSSDLVNWESLGGALELLPSGGQFRYWAPEVAERDGRFFLYYSAATGPTDDTHRLRVAVADSPSGPFVDSGEVLLPDQGFTIDAHPFRDPKDDQWYLFFAQDFFDARPGTALAAVRLRSDMRGVAGLVTPILRPSDDWQIHERNRHHYGRSWDAWHTVEGAFVVFHDNRYWCLYSGGSFKNDSYGVGVAVSEHVLGPYTEPVSGPSVLRGVANAVIGPGHNSVVPGPDGITPFIVYHAWDLEMTARRMCIDPLVWTPAGPRCAGPTHTPQTIDVASVR